MRRFAPALLAAPLLLTLAATAPAKVNVSAVTNPGASDRVRVGDDLHIAWTDLGTGLLNLHYQKSGSDTTWYSISSVAQASAGQYNLWQVLPFPGPMRIRVTAAEGENISYYYSGQFTVVQLDVTAPGFLTSWQANTVQNITWTYSNNAIPYVKLEYTLNGADSLPTWTLIRDSVPIFPATYAWSVPNTNTSYARVRVSEVNTNSVRATGNAFAITGAVGIVPGKNAPGMALFANDAAQIRFTLPHAEANVRLEAIDAQGNIVATLVDGPAGAGSHTVALGASQRSRLPAGVYAYRLKAGNREIVRRAVSMK